MAKITKLVLPVAGLGKRLRPLTFKTPKNLLLLNGKPMIEYVLEEALASSIKEVVLIVNPLNKSPFQNYIRKNQKKFPFRFHLRIQETPGGNGHALLAAEDLVKNQPFAVRFCDDIIIDKKPVLKSLIELFGFYKSTMLLLKRVPKNSVSRYGVVGIERAAHQPSGFQKRIYRITKVIEKPPLEKAPSNLIVIGGYVLTPNILSNIRKVAEALPAIAADAIPINVGLQMELIIGSRIYPRARTARIKNFGAARRSLFGMEIYGWEFGGKRLDCGTLESFRKTEEFLNSRNKVNKLED